VNKQSPLKPIIFQLPYINSARLRVIPLKNTGLLLIASLFVNPSTFFLVDIYTGKLIGSHEVPYNATIRLNNLNIRDREKNWFRFIEDRVKIWQLSIDEKNIITHIREVLGDEELAESIAARTGFGRAEELLSI